VTSQGQRFRRRALRRGYKVDEVDAFLDRVEATLAGDPIGAPVTAQEVHDVVFRVRFGGYDEWQVDLHLDRVERQLGDIEERGAGFSRSPEPRMGPPMRGEDRLAPLRDERMEPMRPSMPPPPMPSRPMSPMVAAQMSGPPLMGNPMSQMSGPPVSGPPMSGRQVSGPPHHMSMPPAGATAPPTLPVGYPRFDDTEYTVSGFGGGHDFGGGRRGRMDMTHEMRIPDISSAFPVSGGGYGNGASPADLQRIDAMRRTFTPRRFGSGYDAVQVNRLFDAIVASLSGRSGMPINEQELDPNQFSLVPGGYFEAEVNQALREVRDLVRR
jgi:DivIVA domain-containing protein